MARWLLITATIVDGALVCGDGVPCRASGGICDAGLPATAGGILIGWLPVLAALTALVLSPTIDARAGTTGSIAPRC
jgi:hypothetical protein